jgi:transposase
VSCYDLLQKHFDKEVIMHVVNHHSTAELKRLMKQQRDARVLLRLQVVLRAKQGQTAPQIAADLNIGRRNLQDWVYRYNVEGLAGLKDRYQGGNQRKLNDQQERRLMAYLDRGALADDGVRRGKDLQQWIHKQFGVLYSLSGLYDMLHRLGYSCLMPRPRHVNANPETQAAFKKKPHPKSKRSPKNIRKNVSKSGSRMKPASANKAP